MLVISLALGAVLIASGGGSDADAPHAAAGPTNTPVTIVATATNPPEPTATAQPTPVSALPFELQERLQALPEKLRNETLFAFSTGTLSQAQLTQIVSDYENRNPSVRVGSVLAVSDDLLAFEVFVTGERVEVETVDQTLIQRGEVTIALEDLMVEELVMVVSTDEGATALTIDAFGVVAP
jgi:hypothetical protein